MIETKADESENRKLLYDYVKKYDYQLHHLHDNYIVLTDETVLDATLHTAIRFYIFLFSGNNIYYCALKSGKKLNLPSLLHYWIIRKDIKKWVKKRDNNFPPHLPL